jgi:hypothetical protein
MDDGSIGGTDEFNLRQDHCWTRANVRIGLKKGLDLREAYRIFGGRVPETYLHKGNLTLHLRRSPIGYANTLGKGDEVEVVVRGTSDKHEQYTRNLCAYLASEGMKGGKVPPFGKSLSGRPRRVSGFVIK